MDTTTILGLNAFAWIVILLMLGKVLMLVKSRMPSDLTAMGIIAILLLTGTLTTEQALSCFSSTTVVMLAVMFIIAGGLVHTGVTHWISKKLLGTPKSFPGTLLRLMLPVASLSAFVNNNVVVTIFVGIVKVWSKKIDVAPSKLLIPLSYAAGLGGICTIIGAPSNILISDLYSEKMGSQLSIFAPFLPGFMYLLTGIAVVILLRKLLPLRKSPEESFESSGDYTVELMVPTDCPYIGSTIEESGLANVPGGHLIEIVRFDREVISPVPKDEFIMGGDHLVFSGQIESILDLRTTHGLVNATHHVFSVKEIDKNRKLQMANVKVHSQFVGCMMNELKFEDQNNVVLVAVSREGERLSGIPREIKLHSGDTLLLEGDKLRAADYSDDLDFFDTVALPQESKKTLLSAFIVLCMVLLSVTNTLPLLNSCMLAAILMVVTHCCSFEQAQQSINWKLILIFAGSVCLGKALTETGLSSILAQAVINASGTNALLSLVVLCLCSMFMTEFISNSIVAAILAPVGLSIALSLSVNPATFCISLIMSISSSFISPFGSESHIIVLGAGGYKFTDFVKIGLPMSIIMLIANIILVNIFFPLYQ